MATEFSMTSIMNAALLAEGMDEIDSSQTLPEQRLLSKNWPFIVETELEVGNFHFTKTETTLLSRTDGRFGYDDAYLVPPGALHVRKLWKEEADGCRWEPDWVQDNRYVYLDSDDGCIVETISVTDEQFWTPSFSNGIKMRLQALILRAVKEEKAEAERMDQAAEMQLQNARTFSSKARSASEPFKRRGGLANARLGRG